MPVSELTISKRLSDLSVQQVHDMATIVANYFPDQQLMEETVRMHMKQADAARLAMHEGKIIGFSVASKISSKTPFYPRPVNVLFQRMPYLDPVCLYRDIGKKLLVVTRCMN